MFFPFDQSSPKFVNYPSKMSSHRQSDYIIEPWQKDTTEMDNKFHEQRAYKTFYEVPVPKPNHNGNFKDRNFLMQKTFSNRKEWDSRGNRLQHTNRQISRDRISRMRMTDKVRTGSVSQYNFNNSTLAQIPEPCQRRFSNQFYLKRLKWNKDKNRDKSSSLMRENDKEVSPIRMNLQSIKKRVTMNRQAEQTASKQLVRINSENEEQMSLHLHLPVHALRERRKNKVIALGYQKLSVLKGISKQRSLNLSHRSPLP